MGAKTLTAWLVAGAVAGFASAAHADGTVRIGLSVPNQAFYTAVFAARDLGYFKNEKVDVEITEFNGGGAAQEAVVAGGADMMTYFPAGVGMAVSKGAKEKIVGTITPGSSGWYMLVLPDSPIKSIKELADKKVGITVKGSTTDLYALWTAERAGVTIRTIPVGGGGLIPALKARQVDAIVAFSPLSLQLLSTSTGRPIVDYAKELPPSLTEAWVASDDMIAKRPDDIHRTLAAFYRAVRYMRQHKDEAIVLLKKYTRQEDPKILDLAFQNATMQESMDGVVEEQWVENSLRMAEKYWNLPELAKIKAKDIYTDKFFPFKAD
jgi:ABC-type nitrate/sulfonate/bicarbonate transport system substrate-binding protein